MTESTTNSEEELIQYEVSLSKYEAKSVTASGKTLSDAVKAAKLIAGEGFLANDATELIGGEAVGELHEVTGQCEGCEVTLFDFNGQMTADHVELCNKCFEALKSSQGDGRT